MKKLLPYLLIAVLILVDQLIKWWALKHPLFISKNIGFIFGYGSNWDLFFLLTIILILGLFLITLRKPASIYPFSLMLAGALSNLIDRFFCGGVIDYLKLGFLKFNLADILLITGAIVYAWQIQRQNQN